MKYLKKFDNHAAYDAAKDGLILPNVSLCVNENEVHYNPSTPPTPPTPIIDGHEYVDLGLPSGTKWATMNVGATSETDYGYYYQYGKGAAQYAATSGQSNYSGTEDPLAASADTAVQVWGGQWHMPTKTQFEELTANTTYEWTTIDGVSGGKFTSTNGKYVFFPAAGYYGNGSQDLVGSNGFYYSSTSAFGDMYSYGLVFNNNSKSVDLIDRDGQSIRPVVG